MLNLQISPASPAESTEAARLTFMAYHKYSYDIFGQVGEAGALRCFEQLWQHGNNRFGYKFSYIARLDNKPVGLMTCYPVPLIRKLTLPTMAQLTRIGGAAFLFHFISHLSNFYYFSSTDNLHPQELYIATLSVKTDFRGLGIGGEMLRYARKLTQELGLNKCCLHVNAENKSGIRFYERNGFSKAPPIPARASYYRMIHPCLY